MAVAAQTPLNEATGNGASTVFSYTFLVLLSADLAVKIDGVLQQQGVDYTVSGAGDAAGGTVTFTTAPDDGALVAIYRDTTKQRATDYQDNGDLLADTVNRDFDRLWLALQETENDYAAAVRAPVGESLPVLPVAADRAELLLGFDSNGDPIAVAPTDGTSEALALLLASSAGAGNVGVDPTGGIAATTVQAALAEIDSEWRAASSTTNGNVAALDTRLDVLEAVPAGSGIIAKDTQATLYADLAHAAGTLGFVTNDSTSANNGWYRKVGGSGSGSWVQSDIEADAVTNAAGQLAYRLHQAVPVYGDDVVALKVADDRWIIRVPVVDGSPHDYTEFEMFQWGTYMGITHAWALHSIRARIGGVMVSFMEQHPSAGNVSTTEWAFKIGKLADYMADATRWNNASYFDYYGFGHGHMSYLGLTINLDGGGTNYRDISPVGTELRGTSITFSASFGPKTPDGTVVGTHAVSHVFSSAGLQVAHQAAISTAGIVAQNCYAAMLPFTGVNRIKAEGVTATTVGLQDGSQLGNWGAVDTFAGYYDDQPTSLCELILPYGGPIGPSGDWSEATTSRTFVLDNANKIRKLYVNWRSGAVSSASAGDTGTPPPTFFGSYSFNAYYRVRKGAAT